MKKPIKTIRINGKAYSFYYVDSGPVFSHPEWPSGACNILIEEEGGKRYYQYEK